MIELLYFSSPQCVPCRSVEPRIDVLSSAWFVPVTKVDVGDATELTRRYRVTSIPCLILTRNKEEIERTVGTSMEGIAKIFWKASNEQQKEFR